MLLLLALQGCTEKASCPEGALEVDGACVEGCAAPTDVTVAVEPGAGTLSAAVAAASEGDVLGLAPGTYDEPDGVELPVGLRIAGWCSEATVVLAGFDAPAFAAEDVDLALVDLTVDGGARGVSVVGSVPTAVTLEGVVIRGAGTAGVRVAGDVDLTGTDLQVEDPIPGSAGYARGVSAQAGARVRLASSRVTGAVEVGIFADGSSVELDDVTVSATEASSSGIGRAVQGQSDSALVLRNVLVDGAAEVGVLALESDISMEGGEVRDTREGDAIAVLAAGATEAPLASLTDVGVTGSGRAGVLVDGLTVTVQGLGVTGATYSYVTQNGADLDGLETCSDDGAERLLGLEGADALPVDETPLALDAGR